MGLSASQARLLSLTSRMSDLELQAQMISNAKIRLADQGKLVSQNYSDALNKQTLKVYSGVDDNGGTAYATATARNLTTYDAASPIDDKQRLIKDSAGRLVISGSLASAYAASGNGKNFESFLNSLGFTQYSVNETLNNITGNLSADVATLSDAMTNGVAEYVNLNDETVNAPINNAEAKLPDVKTAFTLVKDADTLTTFKTSCISTLTTALYGDIFKGVTDAANASSAPTTTFKTNYTDAQVYAWMQGGHYNWDAQGHLISWTRNSEGIYDDAATIDKPNVVAFAQDLNTEYHYIKVGNQYVCRPTLPDVADNLWDNTTGSKDPIDDYGKSIGVDNNANDLQTVTDDTKAALKAILGGKTLNGNNNAEYWIKVNAALDAAQTATKNLYQDRLQNDNGRIYRGGGNSDTVSGIRGKNIIGDAQDGFAEFYFDKNQVIKTFLDYFDAGCANIDNNDSTSGDTYTGKVGGSDNDYTTTRPATGGIGDENIYNYSDVQKTDGTAGTDGIDDAYLNNLRAAINAVNIENYAANHNAEKRWVPNNSSGMSSALAGIQATFSNITAYDSSLTIPGELNGASIKAGDKTVALTLQAQLLAGLGKINVNSIKNTIISEINAERTQSGIKEDPGAVIYYANIFNAIAEGGAIQESDENMNSPEWLQAGIKTGTLFLYTQAKQDDDFKNVSWTSGDSSLSEESSDRDTAKAEAEYKSATADIAAKDNRFDLKLKQLDTEHSAMKNEIDSVKKVIDKNIQSSLKIFDA